MSVDIFIYALLAGILPSFIWLHFWVREDANREPKPMLASAFLSGILAVFVAVFIEKYFATVIPVESWKFLSWAATEEIVKLLAIAIVALNSDFNDEPIDAMIYCIVTALGFSAFENALFILGPLSDGNLIIGMITGNMRFIGSTLVHIVGSAIIGFSMGVMFYRGYVAKTISLLIGIAFAIFFHTAFNLSIINVGGTEALRIFAWVWLAVVILIILFEEIKVVRPKIKIATN